MIVKLEFLIEVFFSEIIVLEIMSQLHNDELYCSVSDRIIQLLQLLMLQMLVSINTKRLIIRYVVVVGIRSVWLRKTQGSVAFGTKAYIWRCFLCIQVSFGNWGTKEPLKCAILARKPRSHVRIRGLFAVVSTSTTWSRASQKFMLLYSQGGSEVCSP